MTIAISKSFAELEKLYSADKIPEGKARGVVSAGNKYYVVTSISGSASGQRKCEGYEVIPVAVRKPEHPEPCTYSTRSAQQTTPGSFYTGVVFNCAKTKWMILGNRVEFATKESKRTEQMEMTL